MPRALCLLPDGPNYRRGSFLTGLTAAGLEVVDIIDRPEPGDALVIWNRPRRLEGEARRFERAGACVLVAENGYLGKQWQGKKWFALARGHHSGAGDWRPGGADRWDSWGVEPAPWRQGGTEILVLAQRGIGELGLASPPGWAEEVAQAVGGRIRQHPGAEQPALSLSDDISNAKCVVTWNSGAALLTLLCGVPVFHACPAWIGADASMPLTMWGREPRRDGEARLAMLRRMSWAMWSAEEIETGAAFGHLLRR